VTGGLDLEHGPEPAAEHRQQRRVADLAMFGVTVMWAISFALMKDALGEISPVLFVGLRFMLAGLVVAPLLLRGGVIAGLSFVAVRDSLALGAIMFASFATQITGLRSTTAANCAFVTATCTLMLPLLERVVYGRRPRRATLGGIALAMVGLFLLVRPSANHMAVGDLWTLLSAFLYAIYVVRLDMVVRRHPYQVALCGQIAGAAVLGLALSPVIETPHFALTVGAVRSLLLVVIFPTIGSLYLQSRFQSRTTPTRAGLIFTAEPVLAAGFAYVWLGEVLPPVGYLGAALVVSGIVLSELV
jgi:drug/metabolite transporter (DMT)-like permease